MSISNPLTVPPSLEICNDLPHIIAMRSQVRKAGEQQGSVVLTYLKWMRKKFDNTGVRFEECVGGETHLTGDLPPSYTAIDLRLLCRRVPCERTGQRT